MTIYGTEKYELFLLAMEVEEQVDTDYFSFLYLPAFRSPFYVSLQLSEPCSVKLYIPLDEWDSKRDLDRFEHYWDAEKQLSPAFSDGILSDSYSLKSRGFADYYDPYTRDGFAAYCKGVFEGEPFSFFTQNPNVKGAETHCQYLLIIWRALKKAFPNLMVIQHLKDIL